MPETLVSPDVLRYRASLITRSLSQMFEQGLPKDKIRAQEKANPQSNRDIFLVLLGLKPWASGMDIQATYMHRRRNYIQQFPREKELGVPVLITPIQGLPLPDVHIINKSLLRSTCLENTDLLVDFINKHPNQLPDYTSSRYVAFLNALQFRDFMTEPSAMKLAGVLHGVPRIVVDPYVDYYSRLDVVMSRLWNAGWEERLDISSSVPTIEEVALNKSQEKKELLQLVQRFGVSDMTMINYALSIRQAKVPGFKYITVADVTKEEEDRISELYKASQMDKKLSQLLST